MGHAQCGLCCGTPPLLQTRHSDDSSRLSVETSTLHSNTHNGDSGRSSQTFPASSLEAPQPSKVHNLGPWTSVHSSFHPRTLPSARNKVGVLHGLASLDRRTDRARQPKVGPVPPVICEWTARRLVRPITHSRIPAQQSCPLRYPTASVSARHRMASLYGLRTLTEPFQSRDSQWIHGKNEDGDRRSEVRNPQSTERHEKILWLTKNSSSSIQPRW